MFKLIKYFRPFLLSLVSIFLLLVVQASCELSLPEYTSNIINVGIQQEGIENSVPKFLRKITLDKLSIFLNEKDLDFIKENYTLSDDIYTLKKVDKETKDKLDSIMEKPFAMLNFIEMQKNQELSSDLIGILKSKKIDTSKLDDIEESMLSQLSISYIKNEYEKIGVDLAKLKTDYILKAGSYMLFVALIGMASTITVGYFAAKISAGIGKNLRKDVFKKVVNFSNAEFDEFSTASLITRSTNDINRIQTVLVMMIRMLFYAPILAVGGILNVIRIDYSMGWILVLATVLIILVVLCLFKFVMPKFKVLQKMIDKLNLITREMLTGMLVIRAFGTEENEEKRFDDLNARLTKLNTFLTKSMSITMPIMTLIMNMVSILIVWVGAKKIDMGYIQVGDMMAFLQYSMQIIMAFLFISMLSVTIPRASVSANRIYEVLNKECSIKEYDNLEFNSDDEISLEFKNVSFKYPNSSLNAVENIDFVAKKGETIAFIGSTGSGKSTIMNLISRFYDVTSGEILINDVNIKNIKQKNLRNILGYVPQKAILFTGDIKGNISYGKIDTDFEEIKKYAYISQSLEFIEKKEKGFDEEVSQGGSNFSGGQKQRLSIARALCKNPKIYIFDDSFSALDLKTESILRKKLSPYTKDAITLIVAQRISTIVNADKIIVLDEGKIVGSGKHDYLINNCEVYKQIALSQLSKEEL